MIKLVLAAALPIFAVFPLYAVELPLNAAVADINGEVSARPSGSAPWAAVKNGDMIPTGSEVRTAKGGSAVVAFSDNNKVKLGSGTIFAVDSATTRKTAIRLVTGKITAWVKRVNKADFTVRHRAGVAAVRGTILGAEGTEAGLIFTLFEGMMDVTDAFGRSSPMSAGQAANLSQEGGNLGTSSLPAATETPAEPNVAVPAAPTTASSTTPEATAATEDISADETPATPAATTSPVQESATTVSPSAPAETTSSPPPPPPA